MSVSALTMATWMQMPTRTANKYVAKNDQQGERSSQIEDMEGG